MRKKQQNGFTLIELIVAMTIVGIISVMAIPSYKATNINNRLLSETNLLNNVFSFARSEAFRRNNYVSICATTDFSTCNSSDFNTGTLVFSDPNKAGLSNTNQILKAYDPWQGSDHGKITIADGSAVYTFNGVPSPISSGSVLVCTPGYNSYTITLSNIGSLKIVSNTGDGGC